MQGVLNRGGIKSLYFFCVSLLWNFYAGSDYESPGAKVMPMRNNRVPRVRGLKNGRDGVHHIHANDRTELRVDLIIIRVLVGIAIVFVGYKIAVGVGLFA